MPTAAQPRYICWKACRTRGFGAECRRPRDQRQADIDRRLCPCRMFLYPRTSRCAASKRIGDTDKRGHHLFPLSTGFPENPAGPTSLLEGIRKGVALLRSCRMWPDPPIILKGFSCNLILVTDLPNAADRTGDGDSLIKNLSGDFARPWCP